MKYLLDTNTCVFVIRQKSHAIVQRLRTHVVGDVGISSVTLAELRFGADKSHDPPKNHAALDAFLAPLATDDFGIEAAEQYGKVRADLESRGLPIGPLDTMIAAHALSLHVTLVIQQHARVFAHHGLIS